MANPSSSGITMQLPPAPGFRKDEHFERMLLKNGQTIYYSKKELCRELDTVGSLWPYRMIFNEVLGRIICETVPDRFYINIDAFGELIKDEEGYKEAMDRYHRTVQQSQPQ